MLGEGNKLLGKPGIRRLLLVGVLSAGSPNFELTSNKPKTAHTHTPRLPIGGLAWCFHSWRQRVSLRRAATAGLAPYEPKIHRFHKGCRGLLSGEIWWVPASPSQVDHILTEPLPTCRPSSGPRCQLPAPRNAKHQIHLQTAEEPALSAVPGAPVNQRPPKPLELKRFG